MRIFGEDSVPCSEVHIPQEETNLNHKQIIPKDRSEDVTRRLGYVDLGDYSEFSLDLYMISVRQKDGELKVGLDYPNNSAYHSGFEYTGVEDLLERDFVDEEELKEELSDNDVEEMAAKYLKKHDDHLRTVEDDIVNDTVDRIVQ